MAHISSPSDIGETIKRARKTQGLAQQEPAGLCGVGVLFLQELEREKESSHLGKTPVVLQVLGLVVTISKRDQE